MYFPLIYSRLNYAIENWRVTDKLTLNPLKVTQNHFARIISNQPKLESALSIFKRLKILSLQLFLFVFKVLKLFFDRSRNNDNDRIYVLKKEK